MASSALMQYFHNSHETYTNRRNKLIYIPTDVNLNDLPELTQDFPSDGELLSVKTQCEWSHYDVKDIVAEDDDQNMHHKDTCCAYKDFQERLHTNNPAFGVTCIVNLVHLNLFRVHGTPLAVSSTCLCRRVHGQGVGVVLNFVEKCGKILPLLECSCQIQLNIGKEFSKSSPSCQLQLLPARKQGSVVS
ncbi:hypothetical protein FHG87_007998 [Trinorchestia longiramus]|nr:hypothetical protein FHG87_007998 [Trinorchestia longiramus]